jgi:hypothetical protein
VADKGKERRGKRKKRERKKADINADKGRMNSEREGERNR